MPVKQKSPILHMAEEMGLFFSCNTITGHVILLFEVQKQTEINPWEYILNEYTSQFNLLSFR